MYKKGQAVMEFFMTYGWAILVVIAAVLALVYFEVLSTDRFLPIEENTTSVNIMEDFNNNINKSGIVCSNLDYVRNDTSSIFPEVITSKQRLEQGSNMVVYNIHGDTSEPFTYDDRGVMCGMKVDFCDIGYNYCTELKMIVPVNYTIWENWYIN